MNHCIKNFLLLVISRHKSRSWCSQSKTVGLSWIHSGHLCLRGEWRKLDRWTYIHAMDTTDGPSILRHVRPTRCHLDLQAWLGEKLWQWNVAQARVLDYNRFTRFQVSQILQTRQGTHFTTAPSCQKERVKQSRSCFLSNTCSDPKGLNCV